MMTAECWVLIPHRVVVVLLRLGRLVTRGERREETEYNWEQLDNWLAGSWVVINQSDNTHITPVSPDHLKYERRERSQS